MLIQEEPGGIAMTHWLAGQILGLLNRRVVGL